MPWHFGSSNFLVNSDTKIDTKPFSTTWALDHFSSKKLRHLAWAEYRNGLCWFDSVFITSASVDGEHCKLPPLKAMNEVASLALWWNWNLPGGWPQHKAVASAIANTPQSSPPACIWMSMKWTEIFFSLVASRAAIWRFKADEREQYFWMLSSNCGDHNLVATPIVQNLDELIRFNSKCHSHPSICVLEPGHMLNWSASIVWAAFTMSSVSQFDPSRIMVTCPKYLQLFLTFLNISQFNHLNEKPEILVT